MALTKVKGAVFTAQENNLSLSPIDEGAKGDGVTDDTSVFTAIDAAQTGENVHLGNLNYKVSATPLSNIYPGTDASAMEAWDGTGLTSHMPSDLSFTIDSQFGNYYEYGTFETTELEYSTQSEPFYISDETDTRFNTNAESVFNIASINVQAVPGQVAGTDVTKCGNIGAEQSLARGEESGNIFSQQCVTDFARAVNVGSIRCYSNGNVVGNYSSRLCESFAAEAANLASEESDAIGNTRVANISSIFGWASGNASGNIGTRRGRVSAPESGNIAVDTCTAGTGYGGRASAVVGSGVITSITVDDGGAEYVVAPDVDIQDKSGNGVGATATANIAGDAIVSYTVTNGGANYVEQTTIISLIPADTNVANVAATSCIARGTGSAIIAANGSNTTAVNSGVLAADSCDATGDRAVVIGSESSNATANMALVAGSSGGIASGIISSVISGNICEATADGAVLFGRRTINNDVRSIAFGDAASGVALTANRKFQVLSNGDVNAAGTITGSVVFTDYAEYFENASAGVIPLGTLVTLDGDKVKAATTGDDVLGVVSATALVVAGDSQFTWAKRYLTGEFGELLYHDVDMVKFPRKTAEDKAEYYDGVVTEAGTIPKDAVYYTESIPQENPSFNPELANIPRSERPAEWTCVGLLGQIHTRVAATVNPGDYINPLDGHGIKSESPTNIRVMTIKQAFDADKGYSVALCLVK